MTSFYSPALDSCRRRAYAAKASVHEEDPMFFDTWIDIGDLRQVAGAAQAAEQLGFDALWTSEIAHDPYLPLALAAAATTRITLGTAIALAFTRSPTTTAYTAWDLARLSEGRFILGLGTQVQAHIERRFGLPWDAPV